MRVVVPVQLDRVITERKENFDRMKIKMGLCKDLFVVVVRKLVSKSLRRLDGGRLVVVKASETDKGEIFYPTIGVRAMAEQTLKKYLNFEAPCQSASIIFIFFLDSSINSSYCVQVKI